ncbi:hypothetical protein DFQ26_001938 [Actinomortierella ambigua]|nr:hypothetical protein DFQ26_001938 [Actinomortierella ambigua]
MPINDRNMVIQGVEELGGVFSMDMTDDVTHLIAVNPESSPKYQYALDHPQLGIKIVLPHWFQTCFNLRRRFPETIYLLPNPPLHDLDYVVSKTDIPSDSAPQLYANSLRPVITFLKEPSMVPSQSLVLQNKVIILAKDLFVLPDLRASFVEKIQEAGGSILEDEGEYDQDIVDIVICRYRKGHLYKQASKDGKIVASIDWLLSVLQTGKLTSPMGSLLHYPIPFRPIPGMSGKVITISNYNGPIREYIKRLIVTMGAVYKSTLTSPYAVDSTTHVICGDASGEKYEKGQEWNVKIVNHLWVEDCFLEWAIQSETKHKYLSFVFGAKLSPELVDEWVDVADGNESDARSDMSPKETKEVDTRTESAKSDMPSPTTDNKQVAELDGRAHPGSNADKAEARPTARKKASKAVQEGETTTESPAETIAENTSASGAGAGGIRVISRARGAALEASKNLKKNVSDMNAFQKELRNEKRTPKKKRKMTDNDGDSARDESIEPEESEQDTKSPAAGSGEPLSPGKRRRTSTTPAVAPKSGRKGKTAAVAAAAQAEETHDIEMEEEEQEEAPRTLSKKAAQKESKDGVSTSGSPRGPVRYITTSTVKIPAKLAKQLKALGVTEAKSVEQCTHLVANSVVRTEKFLYAIPACKEIVHEDWLQACADANQILGEGEYPVKDAAGERKYKVKLADAMKRARQGKVFEGCLFYFTPNTQPKMGVLKPLVEIGGGKTTALLQTGLSFIGEKIQKAKERAKRRDSKASKRKRKGQRDGALPEEEMVDSGEDEKDEDQGGSESESEPSLSGDEQERTIIVISSKEDSDMWKPVLDAGASVYSTELVLMGLFRQELDLQATHNYVALRKVPKQGPKLFQRLDRILSKYTPWQILVGTFTVMYASHHADLFLGLTPAEEEKKMYSRRYTRAYTRSLWVFGALDAGFFTSQHLQPRVLRDAMSVVFTIYYLFFPKRAQEKLHMMHNSITPQQMRLSWEKVMHPALQFLSWVKFPRLGVRKTVRLTMSKKEGYHSDGEVTVSLFFKGTEEELAACDSLILDFPGGGFVAMHPGCHTDYLIPWAYQTGKVIVSVDYKKAPEYPFPHGVFECYDVYKLIVNTRGRCVGLSGDVDPSIVLVGDSAGGTMVTSAMNMIIETPGLRRPSGVLLIYPCTEVGLEFWISNEHLQIIEEEIARGPIPDDILKAQPGRGDGMTLGSKAAFADDQLLGTPFLRALMVMYIGGDTSLDHKTDYLMSPIHTPDHVLQEYPRTYIITGEKDPLCDDSVIFMAKLRRAKRNAAKPCENDTLRILNGVSHAFMQMMNIAPEYRDVARVLGEELSDMLRTAAAANAAAVAGADQSSPSNTKELARKASHFVTEWEQKNTRDAFSIYEHRRVAYLDVLGIDAPVGV